MRGFWILLAAVFLCVPVAAEEYTYALRDVSTAEAGWEELLGSLPEEEAERLRELDLHDPEAALEAVRRETGIAVWLERIVSHLRETALQAIPDVLPLLTLILLTAAAEFLLPESPVLRETFGAYSSLFLAVTVFRMTDGLLAAVRTYLNRVCGVMNLLVPVLETLCLAGGNVAQSSVTTVGVMLTVTLLGNFSAQILAPLTTLLVTLSIVTTTCGDSRLGGLIGSFRKLLTRLWQFFSMGVSFFLGVQTLLAKSADGLASRTVRLLLGSFVPVAGGLLSEAYSTLSGGLGVVRNTAGIGGILVILGMCLPGIVPLWVYRLMLSLTGTAAEMFRLDRAAGLCRETRGTLEFLSGIVWTTALMLVFALFLCMKIQTG